MGSIGIIEYGMGNIQSVVNAFDYLHIPTRVVEKPKDLFLIDKIVLPGVGAFGEGMSKLKALGFIDALQQEVIKNRRPFLGICLGMQLICKESFEFGHFTGLGWIDASVLKLPDDLNLRIPHVGWNNLTVKKPNRLINVSAERKNLDVYFVHSYYVEGFNSDFTIASCNYGIEFTAIIEQDNIFATQFHPEKSQRVGLSILKMFSEVT